MEWWIVDSWGEGRRGSFDGLYLFSRKNCCGAEGARTKGLGTLETTFQGPTRDGAWSRLAAPSLQ